MFTDVIMISKFYSLVKKLLIYKKFRKSWNAQHGPGSILKLDILSVGGSFNMALLTLYSLLIVIWIPKMIQFIYMLFHLQNPDFEVSEMLRISEILLGRYFEIILPKIMQIAPVERNRHYIHQYVEKQPRFLNRFLYHECYSSFSVLEKSVLFSDTFPRIILGFYLYLSRWWRIGNVSNFRNVMLRRYISLYFLMHFCSSGYHDCCFIHKSRFVLCVLEMWHGGCYRNRCGNFKFNYQLHRLFSLMSSVHMKHKNNMLNS